MNILILEEELERQLLELKKTLEVIDPFYSGDQSVPSEMVPKFDDEVETEDEDGWIFVSDVGITYRKQINNIIDFWTKVLGMETYPDQFSFIFQETGIKITQNLIQAILGEKVLEAFQKDIGKQKGFQPSPGILNTKSDLDMIVSMTIIILSGFSEDFLNQIEDEIFDILVKQDKIEDGKEFLKKKQSSPILGRIDNCLNSMGLRKKVKKIIGKSLYEEHRYRFSDFYKKRNQLAHTSQLFDTSVLQEDIENMMIPFEKLENLVEAPDQATKDRVTRDLKNLARSYTFKFMLIIRISFDCQLYLSILDRCFHVWMQVSTPKKE